MAKAKRARDAKGHFISNKAIARRKGGGKPAKRSASSSKPARRASGGGGKPARRGRRSVRISGGVLNTTVRELKAMGPELGGALAYGFITKASTPTAVKIRAYVDKVPTWDRIGKPASHGVLLLAGGIAVGGKARRLAGLLAKAALFRAMDNVGATALDLEAAAKLSGDDDVHLAGEISDADVIDD